MSAAIPARSAMDNALFAVNYWTVIGGLGLARITPGLTAQAGVSERAATITLGLGPRFHFKLGKGRWLRPGLS